MLSIVDISHGRATRSGSVLDDTAGGLCCWDLINQILVIVPLTVGGC